MENNRKMSVWNRFLKWSTIFQVSIAQGEDFSNSITDSTCKKPNSLYPKETPHIIAKNLEILETPIVLSQIAVFPDLCWCWVFFPIPKKKHFYRDLITYILLVSMPRENSSPEEYPLTIQAKGLVTCIVFDFYTVCMQSCMNQEEKNKIVPFKFPQYL